MIRCFLVRKKKIREHHFCLLHTYNLLVSLLPSPFSLLHSPFSLLPFLLIPPLSPYTYPSFSLQVPSLNKCPKNEQHLPPSRESIFLIFISHLSLSFSNTRQG